MSQTAIEIKPCPFCGNDGSGPIEDALHTISNEWFDGSGWTVQCDKCTATMGYSEAEDEAIESWNSRAALSALTQGGVKGLEWEQLYEKQTIHPKEWHGTGIFDARYIIKQRLPDSDFFVVGKNHSTLEAAKAAAQADYDARILSALSTKLQEPVGEDAHRLAKFGSPNVAPLGLYRVHWKSGGSSLAAIGMMENGDRWIAPTNWVRPGTIPSAGEWGEIERLEPIDATLAHQPVTAGWEKVIEPVGWIPWTGGDFMPVTGETSVWIQSRSGKIEGPTLAREWAGEDSCWKHSGGGGDIIAYSLTEPTVSTTAGLERVFELIDHHVTDDEDRMTLKAALKSEGRNDG